MKISIEILNNDFLSSKPEDQPKCSWYSRIREYFSDFMDEDIKVCTVSHYVNCVKIDDCAIKTQAEVDAMIEFLTNCKPSFQK